MKIRTEPYFRKKEDTMMYTVYVSFDEKHKTVYNKNTHAIHYIKNTKPNRFRKYKDA